MKNGKRKSWCPSFRDVVKFVASVWVLFNGPQLVQAQGTFPEDGNYKKQSDWVKQLVNPCEETAGNVVEEIASAENPFQKVDTHAQQGKKVKVWHHDFDSEFGVVTRRTKETAQDRSNEPTKDIEEVMIGGESQDGTLQPITFTFQRGKDGLMRPTAKKKMMVTEFAEGVEQAGKEGLVVKMDNNYGSCYTARLKDKKNT